MSTTDRAVYTSNKAGLSELMRQAKGEGHTDQRRIIAFMFSRGASYLELALFFGVSRNAIAGIVDRQRDRAADVRIPGLEAKPHARRNKDVQRGRSGTAREAPSTGVQPAAPHLDHPELRRGKSTFAAAAADAAEAAGLRVHRPKASDPIGGFPGTELPAVIVDESHHPPRFGDLRKVGGLPRRRRARAEPLPLESGAGELPLRQVNDAGCVVFNAPSGCRWIEGDPREGGTWCNRATTTLAAPYCEHHLARAVDGAAWI